MKTQRRRAPAGFAALVGIALVIGGCTSTGDSQDDEDAGSPHEAAAEAIASALNEGDFSAAPLPDDVRIQAQEEADEVLGEVADIPRSVEVNWVSSVYDEGEGQAADAALRVTWQLPGDGDEWAYPISVNLVSEDGETWHAQWSRDLIARELGQDGVFAAEYLEADRGDFLDINDEPLVTNREVYRIGIDKTYIDSDEWEDSALELAEELDFAEPQDYADRVLAHGPRAFVEAVTIPQDNPADLDLGPIRSVAGVNFVSDERVLGPTDTFARPILGRAGEATAEIIENSDGEVSEGDVVGISGLQAQYEEALQGTPGVVLSVVSGEETEEVFRTSPDSGPGVATSFDPELQVSAESVLEGVEPASAIVAIRPSTGDVLAAASGPGSEGWSTATLGQYAPGSTFKVVVALAMLRSGIEMEDTVHCPETITVDGREFSNNPEYPQDGIGEITLAQAIADSCNTVFIAQYEELDPADIESAAQSLGLFGQADMGLPVFMGSMDLEATGTSHAASLIGQGNVLASPLGMATVAASLSAAETVRPTLIRNLDDLRELGVDEGDDGADGVPGDDAEEGADNADSGDADQNANAGEADAGQEDDGAAGQEDDGDSESQEDGNGTGGQEEAGADVEPLTNEEAALLRQAMRAAVVDGTAELLQEVPGDRVAAKTGTAEHSEDVTRSWIIGIQGDLAVAVFVEDGESGARTAGPLMRSFLEAISD